MPQARPPGGRAQHDERRVAGGPAERLPSRRRPRLEQERVADERQHRREVRQREQPVRARAGPRAGEPRLHQRARRRQQEVGQPDRRDQHAEDQPRRVLRAGGLPPDARNDRQHGERHEQQRRVDLDLQPRREPMHGEVRVGVAREQCRLEEDEARGPDGRRSAEPRQDLLRHDRLDQEEQERADEDGCGVEEHGAGRRGTPRARRRGRGETRAFYRSDAARRASQGWSGVTLAVRRRRRSVSSQQDADAEPSDRAVVTREVAIGSRTRRAERWLRRRRPGSDDGQYVVRGRKYSVRSIEWTASSLTSMPCRTRSGMSVPAPPRPHTFR